MALQDMLDQVAQTPGLGFQGGPVTYNPQVGGMSSYGDKGYTSSSSVPPSGYQALSATTPQTQGAFNPTPYKDTGLVQSGGNYYLPQSLISGYNPNSSNYALGIDRSMYDSSGSDANGPQYGDISYMPQLPGGGATGQKYFIDPSNLGITKPGEDWMSQIQYNYTDPSTGQQYRNLGSNPFTSVQSVGPVDNTTAAKIGMGLFGGAAIGALAGGAGAAGAGAGAAGGAAGGEAAGAGLGSGLTGAGGAGLADMGGGAGLTGAGAGGLAGMGGGAGLTGAGGGMAASSGGGGLSGGGIAGGVLGLLGSLYGRNAASQTENQFWGIGDPYRAQLQNITNNPDAYFKGPIAQELARQADARYSSQFGNPAGSGTAQALSLQAMLNGYGAERDRLFKEGGGDYMNAAYPAARLGKTNANKGVFGSLQDLIGGSGMFT